MSTTAAQLLARIEAIDEAAADTGRRSETYERMAENLKDVVGHATSDDGVVTVTAGPGGSITEITFTERVHGMSPGALSASVLRAITEATRSAARGQAEVIRAGLGDTELLDRVLDSDELLFGAPRPDDGGPATTGEFTARGPSAATRRRAPIEDEPEDFSDFSVYGPR
jgi:DNA-binding protein YbaB